MRFFNWIAAMVFVPLFVSIAIGPELTLEDLKDRSDAVVMGKVARVRYSCNAERTVAFTYVKIAVTDVVRGNAPQDSVEVILLGGVLDGRISVVMEEAAMGEDEEVLLFLHKNSKRENDNAYRVAGMQQGKFAIIQDKTTGEKRAVREMNERLLSSRTNEHVPTTLTDLLAEIRK